MAVGIVAVSVSLPAVMPGAAHRGRPVRSGIIKQRVTAPDLALSATNLAGDGQADLSVHGGPDKAVYAYPCEHWPAWEAETGITFGPAGLGENLTTVGATEVDTAIGDLWHWGDAVLEVCQPRSPCYKLALFTGTAEVGRRMRASGRCGWYLRVLRPGTVPTTGTITVTPHPARVTVADALAARRDGAPDAVTRALAVPALAGEWRSHLRDVLAG